ncbi:MAG: hypothetical protein JEZ00_13805 [Anaerolineaceae bacterium]|nr:hypothetical protein [Anaerolineaceae bacterium]
MGIYLGVDVGGSKTHALLVDEHGTILGFGETGPGNHESVGYDGLINALQATFQQASEKHNIQPNQITGAGFGIAGYDWPSEREDTLNAITSLGLTCPLEVVNDAVLGLYAGSPQGWGVNLIAGTSNNCYGCDAQGNEGRVTGAGMLFGENGGALEIVVKAVHAVNYQWIKRGPETQLSQRLMDITGTTSLAQLMESLVMEKTPLHPAWAVHVLEIAAQGDPVAQSIMHWAGSELGELAKAVIRQLQFEQISFDLVLSGSLFQKDSILFDPVKKSILALAPNTNLITLDVPPVSGAALLGMKAASIPTSAMFSTLRENIKAAFIH